MTKYPYLTELTKTEFNAVMSIIKKHGIKGLLSIVVEIAEFNLAKENFVWPKSAERVARELAALIERMDGFEELESNR